MRRALSLVLIAAAFALLGGSHGSLREVEQLLVVQTMGLDGSAGQLRLTLAAKGDGAQGVRRMEASGSSLSAALERIRALVLEEELFCAHTGRVLVGEKTAEAGLSDLLEYLRRSPELRLNLPIYVVRGDEAARALLEVGGEERGICDVMDAVDRAARRRGDCGVSDAASILRDTERFGSALVCAVRVTQAAEQSIEGESELTVVPAGYAVLREGKLCRFLTSEQAVAAGLLLGEPGLAEITVPSRGGKNAVLTIRDGGSRIAPVWGEGGTLTGLRFAVRVHAAVTELPGGADPEDADRLTARLEEKLAAALNETLTASKELRADFLGLAAAVERDNPAAFRRLSQPFPDLLPNLTLEVAVSAVLDQAGD